jgi:hypothetical protein
MCGAVLEGDKHVEVRWRREVVSTIRHVLREVCRRLTKVY